MLLGGLVFGQDGELSCGYDPSMDPLYTGAYAETGQRCVNVACDSPFNRDAAVFGSGSPVLKVHLLVHLVRDNQGTGPTLGEVESMLRKARADFRGLTADSLSAAQGLGWRPGSHDTGIDFCWSIRVHDNGYLYQSPSSVVASQVNEYASHQVNVILNANPNSGGAQGTALGNPFGTNPNAHVWIHHSQVSGTHKTLSHELGHYFGLMHPFDRVGCVPCGENMALTAAGRDTTGDMCSDTDPCTSYNGCSAPQVVEACTGIAYTDQFLSNIMSYSWSGCGVSFTPQQGGRMRCYLQTNYQNMLSYVLPGCPEIPYADFSVSPSNTCPGTPVSFTDGSWNASGWFWDFGDGQTSTLRNPVHSYAAAGTYTVSLTVVSGTGLTDTRTQHQAVGVSGGQQLPYVFSFNSAPSVANGWTAQQDPRYAPDVVKWRRMSSLSFVPSAPVAGAQPFTATTHSMGTGAYYYSSCFVPADAGLRKITGPNGVQDTSCLYLSPRSPQAGQYDALVSPPFDLSTAVDPKMSFHFSHLPTGTDQPGMTCDWSFPGLSHASAPYGNPRSATSPDIQPGHPCYQANCPSNNPGCNRTNWGAGEMIGDTLKVFVSTDCGGSWSQVWAGWGEGLNTVPGEVCAPTVYVPRSQSVWRKLEFDLCPYIGESNVQFKILYVQDKFAGNMYVDEFRVGSTPGGAVSVSATSTPDCGIGTGTVTASAAGGVLPYAYSLRSVSGQSSSAQSGHFTGLVTGGYTVSVRDSSGSCAKAQVQVGLLPSLGLQASVTGSSCGQPNGGFTASLVPGGSASFTYTVRDGFGLAVSGPSTSQTGTFSVSGLGAGTYLVELSDASGNCGVDTVLVPSVNAFVPVLTVQPDACGTGGGAVVFQSPLAPGTSYTLRHLSTGVSYSGTTGVFTSLVTGGYLACATTSAGCGCDTVQVGQGLQLQYFQTVTDETCLGANGSVAVTVSGGGTGYVYELYGPAGLLQSSTSASQSHVFQGLPAGAYTVRVTGLQGGCAVSSADVYAANTAQAEAFGMGGHCGSPLGGVLFLNHSGTQMTYTVTGASGPAVGGVSSASQYTVPGLPGGWYVVTATDSAGSCFADSVEVPFVGTLAYTVATTPAACGVSDGIVRADLGAGATGPFMFYLTGPSVSDTLSSVSPSASFGGLAPGTYQVWGTDGAGGCFWAQAVVGSLTGCCAVPTADVLLHGAGSQYFVQATGYAGTATGLEIHVVDTFRVSQDLDFVDCVFWMDSSAVVYIEPGYRVTMDGCTLQASCGYMWGGIVVPHEKSTLVLDSCVVSGAEQAVVSLQGGVYAVSSSLFSDNWVSLVVRGHGSPHAGTFRSSVVTSDAATVLAPHAGEVSDAGIWVEQVDSLVIGSALAGEGNVVENVGVGVFCDRSDLTVVNTEFRGIVRKSPVRPVPFTSGYGCGVYSRGIAGTSPSWVYELSVGGASHASCGFTGMFAGVKAEHNVSASVTGSTFDRMTLGILLQRSVSSRFEVTGNLLTNTLVGVRGLLYAGSDLVVRQNIIMSDATRPGSAVMVSDVNAVGLPQPGSTLVANNEIDFHGFGVNAVATSGLRIEANKIAIHGNYPTFGWGAGISLSGCDSADVENNHVLSYAAAGDSVSGIRSVLSGRTRLACNDLVSCGTGIHFYGPNNLSTVTSNEIEGGRYGLVLENNGLIGDQGSGSAPAGNRWTGGWGCSAQSAMVLTKNTSGRRYAYYANSSASEKPSGGCNRSIGGSALRVVAVARMSGGTSCAGGVQLTPQTAREAAADILGRDYEVMGTSTRELDSEYAAALLHEHDPSSVLPADAAGASIEHLSAYLSGRPAALSQARFEDGGDRGRAYRTVYEALGRVAMGGDAGEGIESLAASCPMENGRAVFQARALGGLSSPEKIFEDLGCDATAAQPAAQPAAAAAVTAFPNPTPGELNVKSAAAGTAELVDAAGTVVMRFGLEEGTVQQRLDRLPAGVYTLRYSLEGGSEGATKIVKI